MNIEQLVELFKWMTIINFGIFIISAVLVMILRKMICRMHSKMFGLTEENVAVIMYSYLGIYKIAIIVFNLVPWIALLVIK